MYEAQTNSLICHALTLPLAFPSSHFLYATLRAFVVTSRHLSPCLHATDNHLSRSKRQPTKNPPPFAFPVVLHPANFTLCSVLLSRVGIFLSPRRRTDSSLTLNGDKKIKKGTLVEETLKNPFEISLDGYHGKRANYVERA